MEILDAKKKKNYYKWFMLGILAVVKPGFFIDKIPHFSAASHLYFFICFLVLIFKTLRLLTVSDAKKISNIAFPVALYLYLLMVTVLTHGVVVTALLRLLYYSYALLLSVVCCKYDAETYIRVVRDILFVLVMINTLSVLAFPSGMYKVAKMTHELDDRYWFLGFKNGIGKFSLFLVTLSGMIQTISGSKRDRIITFVSVVGTVISSVMIESASGVLAGVVPYFIMIVITKTKDIDISSIARMKSYSIFIAFIFLTVVLTTKLLTNSLVEYVVTEVFHKTITLSGRLPIWQNVLKIIKSSPLFGIGTQGAEYNAKLIRGSANTVDAHDYYLEFMLEGGIIALFLLVMMFIKITMLLDKNRKHKEIGVLAGGVFATMLIFITENCNNYFLWIFFGICLSIDTYVKQKNDVVRIFTKILLPERRKE